MRAAPADDSDHEYQRQPRQNEGHRPRPALPSSVGYADTFSRQAGEGAVLEFWYEFASTYSYPAAMRIEALAAERGVAVAWRPFLLGPLLHEHQGMTDSPFNVVPVKGAYMWRDMERVCAEEGLPLTHPSQFPRNTLLAARCATAGLEDGWTPAFSRAVYQANFVADLDISKHDVLEPLLAEVGAAPGAVFDAAGSDAVKGRLKDHVQQARERGLFGSPSFLTRDGELFWGNDRLESALEWAVHHRSMETA